ncbi:hypothetical protein E1B28_004555 [Marasmius oreades]|uniref:Uncharacterized protein n=1 Tax=Marasmius oreades TaxID=181124 RepID=A0A9P8AD70_9AGAR|nr:uncharacterized protein E1B28_004555 [Marasmius oreades]KAG7097183.1 hypothetical protein E1B28_004555 [Marasmius oreades]
MFRRTPQLARVTRTCSFQRSLPASNRQYRRVKSLSGSTSDARDERLLKKLEAQLTAVKEQIKADEQDAIGILDKFAKNSQIENHNAYFWERILNNDDRRQLSEHGINSMEDLQAAYHEADIAMTSPPFPKLESLEPRLQVAHELHKLIPERIAAARRARSSSTLKRFFGGLI